MIKILAWVVLFALLVILAKRISRIIVGIVVFIFSIFLVLFIFDTWLPFDLRSHIPFMQQYDETLDDPKKVSKKVANKVYGTGEGAIKRINQEADKADEKYGTETDSQKEARGVNPETDKEDTSKEKEATEKEEVETPVVAKEEKAKTEKEIKESEKGKIFEDTLSEHFIKYEDFHEVMAKQYPNISKHDYELAYSVTTNLIVDFKGKDYRIWNEADKKDGFYIQKLTK